MIETKHVTYSSYVHIFMLVDCLHLALKKSISHKQMVFGTVTNAATGAILLTTIMSWLHLPIAWLNCTGRLKLVPLCYQAVLFHQTHGQRQSIHMPRMSRKISGHEMTMEC